LLSAGWRKKEERKTIVLLLEKHPYWKSGLFKTGIGKTKRDSRVETRKHLGRRPPPKGKKARRKKGIGLGNRNRKALSPKRGFVCLIKKAGVERKDWVKTRGGSMVLQVIWLILQVGRSRPSGEGTSCQAHQP